MLKHGLKIGFLATMLTAAAMFSGCSESKKALDATVIDNLQAAYNGESNASAKYEMYAKKADEAGYKSVAAMFRATSNAEKLHSERQAKVLRANGVEPKAEIKLPEYVDVAASLADGIKGETYEMTTMYPEFIANAKAKDAPQAVIEAFAYAMDAEKEHARMYAAAAADLENWKAGDKTFYVCQVCGFTSDNQLKVCPLCAAPQEKIKEFK